MNYLGQQPHIRDSKRKDKDLLAALSMLSMMDGKFYAGNNGGVRYTET